ncbi:hypothetical protein VTK56DRAFT_5034 [Thermocarpiscus australiensis]
MMPLFAQSFHAPTEVSFTPLFRLLDDFDCYSREAKGTDAGRRQRAKQPRASPTAFSPKFDVRETEDTYELHGELPGLQRENVNIEFTEPQTIVISGRVERSYGPESHTTSTENKSSAPASESAENSRRNSFQATVEDDTEDDETTPALTPATTPETAAAKPATATRTHHQQKQEVATETPTRQEPRYWLWERSVGEFSRTFSFPAPVDHDAVTASLHNGLLSVTVPKSKKPVTRRIAIS